MTRLPIALASLLLASSFLGASPGVPIPFQALPLPEVKLRPGQPLPPAPGFAGPYAPSTEKLLDGELVITSEPAMREVWSRLFSAPYDPSLFDFDVSFVVLMGGGPILLGSFDISDVEEVTGQYATSGPSFPGGAAERFLSVTSTKFLSGVNPASPPPMTYRVSAVRIRLEFLDDVVFHREVILGV